MFQLLFALNVVCLRTACPLSSCIGVSAKGLIFRKKLGTSLRKLTNGCLCSRDLSYCLGSRCVCLPGSRTSRNMWYVAREEENKLPGDRTRTALHLLLQLAQPGVRILQAPTTVR